VRTLHFFICTNERALGNLLPSCKPAGGALVFDAFIHEIARLGYPEGLKATATGCLTPCQVGPNVVVYPEAVWYAHVTPVDVQEIVDAHLNGRVVERLLKPDDVRVW
jgi:(2Fe-2S) ferredoxin